jgi:hypothetical protein
LPRTLSVLFNFSLRFASCSNPPLSAAECPFSWTLLSFPSSDPPAEDDEQNDWAMAVETHTVRGGAGPFQQIVDAMSWLPFQPVSGGSQTN